MPDVTQSLAPPAYWQQFEDLTVGVARVVFGDPTPQKIGRPGQAQHGIDVLVRSEDGRRIGIQCKRRDELDANNDPLPGGPISMKIVSAAIKEAEGYPAQLDLFVLATTAKPDMPIQGKVDVLSGQRRNAGKFAVLPWSWGDYEAALNRDAPLKTEYYNSVQQGLTAPERDLQLLSLFTEAFSRPAFCDRLSCESPDDFKQAIIDTQRALNTGDLRDRDGYRVRRATGGWHSLDDQSMRDGMRAVVEALNGLRGGLLEAEQAGLVGQQGNWFMIYDPSVQDRLELQRADVVTAMNEVLLAAGREPVRPSRRS